MVDITFWMKKDPATISKKGTILEAVKTMKEKDFDAIVVVEQESPIGIFTESDLLRKVVAEKKDVNVTRVEEVMTSPIESVDKGRGYSEVLSMMKEKKYRHLPVVDGNNKLQGLVTLQGLIQS